jgi:hypothetical protein
MMAGKHISVTHIAGSSTKFMGNGGQHAIATVAAANLCLKYGIMPGDVCKEHLPELQSLATTVTGRHLGGKDNRGPASKL